MAELAPLLQLIDRADRHGGLQNDDVLAVVLPLLREVAALHEQGLVASLGGASACRVTEDGALALAVPGGQAPVPDAEAIARLQAPPGSVLRVVGETQVTHDGEAGLDVQRLDVDMGDGPLARAAYVPDYRAWEQRVGHHDATSDILCLGQVMASLALGLDFTTEEDLRMFAAHRGNLFRLNARLHPVVAGVITEATELDRHRRAQDLPSLIRRLDSYRDQPQDLALDLVAADTAQPGDRRRRAMQVHLRDRLFDLSRRNRLLHFRPTQSTVNLTVASVPLVIDVKSIRREQLCVWGGGFADEVLSNERVPLSRWLRFEDQPYLAGALDRILQEARRDRAEYGFSQLSLVIAFLRWHNLKEHKEERITSPLLLLPVDLVRRKGVRDQYTLEAASTEAEVNPVLRQQLRHLYGIEMPESIDLKVTAVAAFHADLQARIAATEPGVTLRLLADPEIELVHQRAKQRLEQFRRRERARGAPAKAVVETDYSYAADDFRPLGLKLFHERVRVSPLPLRDAVGAPAAVRHPQMASGAVAEATTFALHEAEGHPYLWDVDLTSVTLGNLNYRKMSLVRDYNALIDADLENPAFDRVFSLQPRALDTEAPPALPLAEQWAVVPADATQTAAVALARTGTSYIIQGPPGTGKSQTITNLIADHVGRGRRVLFVCEKRAAIDVVFHRLRQQGLDELCCMIHDSQADKKAFVMNLKQTYEGWMSAEDGLDEAQRTRQALLDGMNQDLAALQRFDAAMQGQPEHAGTPVQQLVRRLVVLRDHAVPLSTAQREALPTHAAWQRHAALIERLQRVMGEVFGAPSFASHPFSHLGDAVVRDERPVARLTALTDAAEAALDRCDEVLANLWPDAGPLAFGDLVDLVAQARLLAEAATRGQLGLLDAASDVSRQLDADREALVELARLRDAAAEPTAPWSDKLSPADTRAALDRARAQEPSFLRWLSPAWWRLWKEVRRRFDFTRQAVRPTLVRVLTELQAEHDARAALDDAVRRFATTYGATDPDALAATLSTLREAAVRQPFVAAFHRRLLAGESGRQTVQGLCALGTEVDTLATTLAVLLNDAAGQPLAGLGECVRDLREHADALPDVLPLLQELSGADPAVVALVRTLAGSAAVLEHAVTREALERLYRAERWLPRFDGTQLAAHVDRLLGAERRLFDVNAQAARAAVRRRFLDNVRRSSLAASQLDADGKAFKKVYSAGRRDLEHEFGKSMRYKAIRELASADSGRVVRDMKPIWLMSPLSVSETLPLDPDLFDVVIFDEASQIPVEDAVPALYRAPQVIVVGDEMQLPPTSFFSSAGDGEGDTLVVEDEGERVAVALDADSLLNQGARNLPATLLAWHYRSRYESLIGFSNAAFYAGNLYTVPDRGVPGGDRDGIPVQVAALAEQGVAAQADALLERPISFHAVSGAVYAARSNDGEARYIAHLVRDLLNRETGLSIGVVAFSEAQQGTIEAALEALGKEDPAFGARLEAEFVREEDDQFCGLFVKNLENVQGDERDIIILSICYAPGPEGRMLMNFGPINQRGGEKRLNVIFSRARHHMAVVSTIRSDAITNDHNDGASALKQFLRYAESASRGDVATAQRVLEGLNPLARQALARAEGTDPVVAALAAALRARGHAVDEHIGQSRFRCDLGIRDPEGGPHYTLAIQVDTAAQYANPDVFERYVSRPRILRAFGWRTVQVLARDWFHEPNAVVDAVERALREVPRPLPEPELPPPGPVVAQVSAPAGPPVAEPSAPGAPVPEGTRRLEFTEGTSRKFWQVSRQGTDVTVTFGRIGTQGQTQVKAFGTEERAQAEVDKLVAEKLRKGYAGADGAATP